MKDLAQMVEEINEAVGGTLSIACFGGAWEAHSYEEESLFNYSMEGNIWANSFTELIEKVYKIVKEESNGTK